jgi:hypothetical protein
MASELLHSTDKALAFSLQAVNRRETRRMPKDFQVRFSALVLAFTTLAAIMFAGINFWKEGQYPTPVDGAWWKESGGVLKASGLTPDGPAAKAGIKVGDELVAVDGQLIKTTVDKEGRTVVAANVVLQRQLFGTGVWSKPVYKLTRNGTEYDAPVVLAPADKSLNQVLRLIALVYLGIGMYVLFRRWTAPKSTHFYLFCLVSFIFYAFHYTGKFNVFDTIVYWSGVVACVLQPALFLHFALTFPIRKKFLEKRPWMASLFYVPAVALIGLQVYAIFFWAFTESLRWNLDRLQMVYQALYFATAAAVLWMSYRSAFVPIVRQQMKWISRGAVLAIAPYTLFYVIPYLSGSLATTAMKISAVSLVLLPLTFCYAILRYRLMDVDIIFKRGVSYTIATAAIVGVYLELSRGWLKSCTPSCPIPARQD